MTSTEAIPRAPECERSIVCFLMQYPGEAAEPIFAKLHPGIDITSPLERVIIQAFHRVYLQTGTADPILVAKQINGRPELDGEEAAVVLLQYSLSEERESFAHLDNRIAEVLDKTERRKLLSISEAIADGARNCQPPETTRRIAQADLDELQKQSTDGAPRFRLISASELDSSTYDQEYLIDDVLVAGEPAVIGGAEKTLKTTIMVDMFVALAAEGYFLGTFPVNRKCRVLMFSGESGLPTLQETFRRICRRAGYTLGRIEGLTLSPDLPQLDNPGDLAACERTIIDTEAEVVGVDPMMLCLGDADADAGNMFAIGKLLRGLAVICQRNNATLVLAHHTHGRATPGAPPKLSDLAWAGFKQFARQWVLLSRREEYVPGTGDHRMWMVTGGSAGHNLMRALDISEGTRSDLEGRHWAVNVTNPGDAEKSAKERAEGNRAAKQAEQFESDRKTVCAALAALQKQTGTKTDIKDATPLNESRFRPAFASLITDRTIVSTTVKKGNNREYDAYTLAQ